MSNPAAWKFADSFSSARRLRLCSVTEYQEVVELVLDSAAEIRVYACRGRDDSLKHCVQPVFDVAVSDVAFDAFYNSSAGYRAQFLMNPVAGLVANVYLIEALFDKLIAESDRVRVQGLEAISVSTSLKATSSKVWINEDDFPFHNLTCDLAVETWTSCASRDEQKAKWGLCAPTGTRIQIKGALLDPAGNEVVPRRKILRHHEIHRFGFS